MPSTTSSNSCPDHEARRDHRAPRSRDQHQPPWLLLVAVDPANDPQPERSGGHAGERADGRNARSCRLGKEEEVADEQPQHRREPEQDPGADEVAPAGHRIAVERARLDVGADRDQSHCDEPVQRRAPGDRVDEDVVEQRVAGDHEEDDDADDDREDVTRRPVARSRVGRDGHAVSPHQRSTYTTRRPITSTGLPPLSSLSMAKMYWPGRWYFRPLGASAVTMV